ncbi:hypothetical protein EXW51_30175 (plasmid) [Bacillus mycoides]|nr:hypothetical protein EXW51_30175 [Bacillus mycoides]
MNRFCFSISVTSFFRVLVSVCPSLGGYLQAFWNFCTSTLLRDNIVHKNYFANAEITILLNRLYLTCCNWSP